MAFRQELTDDRAAELIADHTARGEKVDPSSRIRMSPQWQEVALDTDPAMQDQTIEAMKAESPLTARVMRIALKAAREKVKV